MMLFQSPPTDIDATLEYTLDHRLRAGQQFLDFADYLLIHSSSNIIRRFTNTSPKSFSSNIPLWLELSDQQAFFLYFKQKKLKNVMLFWDKKPSNFKAIEDFCRGQEWGCNADKNVNGYKTAVTILYDLDDFNYEQMTRATQNLIIVTICGNERYFLFI